jgi:hypothetical protein
MDGKGTAAETGPAVSGPADQAAADTSAESGNSAAANNNAGNPDNDNAAENAQPEPDKDADKADDNAADMEDQPIRDWSAVDLGLPKDAAIDESVLAAFGEKSVELGLTPKQAKALASWQLELARETHEAQIEAGVAELRKVWGRKADANQKAVVALLSRVDRQLGSDEFSRAIGASGAANSPAVCKGLLAIAQMLSEDAMGRGGSGDMPVKPETALEGIENAFREMRAKL